MRTLLLTGVSAIALSLATSAATWAADENFDTDRDASANVTGASSTQTDTTNLNVITGNTGQSFSGIMSMLQNNGANSVVNNGNVVSAIVGGGGATSSEDFDVGTDADFATQIAKVTASESFETEVDDDNILDGFAFEQAEGIVSVAQNNGANAAINNGNAVSGVVNTGTSSAGSPATKNFGVHARNNATVEGTTDATSRETLGGGAASTNHNEIAEQAFDQFTGIASVVQNNGANSAINNGNAVSAMVGAGQVTGSPQLTFNVLLDQDAIVKGDVDSTEDDAGVTADPPSGNVDDNTITDTAFQDANGIVSVAQNNGANSAINNGNGVAGIVNSGQSVTAGGVTFNLVGVENSQTASVGGTDASIDDLENDDSPNENTIDASAFQNFDGVASVVQNNGPNSAINNGNSVSAIVLDSAGITSGATRLDSDSTQSATVNAAGGQITSDLAILGQTDKNILTGLAFEQISGVSSTVQNNGSNAAINNGNTVAAFIGEDSSANIGSGGGADRFSADGNSQSALVQSGADPGIVSNVESAASDDENELSGSTFRSADGVHSVVQNNGANAAINNGNSVTAIIVNGNISNAESRLDVAQSQTARVRANNGEVTNTEDAVDDTNTMTGTTFQTADGVASVFQNNGANSAINNGNTVAVLVSDAGSINVSLDTLDGNVPHPSAPPPVSQLAEVNATSPIESTETADSDDLNQITSNAFQESEGVFSVGQNNGPNSAINNGNTVAAAISDEFTVNASGGVDFDVDATQTARVGTTGADDTVTSMEDLGSDDTNTITDSAFKDAAGVFSVLQNNGPNSAINNGNTVAAIISDCATCTGTNSFTVNASFTGAVGTAADATSIGVSNTNEIDLNAFQNARGVFSVTQNNGANAALSNGNVVAAVIDPS